MDVEDSTQRVTIEDGKIVILKYEGNGIYHGYLVDDVKELNQNVKDALVEHGCMKDATSKKLIKK